MVPKYPAARARINRNGSDSSGSEISCDTGASRCAGAFWRALIKPAPGQLGTESDLPHTHKTRSDKPRLVLDSRQTPCQSCLSRLSRSHAGNSIHIQIVSGFLDQPDILMAWLFGIHLTLRK